MDSVYLVGHEDVRSAASVMQSAADDMRNAAGTISSAVYDHRVAMQDALDRFEGLVERLEALAAGKTAT
ncbi:MAG TPA: hypothetical protein VN697_03330 [Tepidiformaceae bacterium]|jgi:hypothetical protein|nr:hypothetical protein [Tepidiformaceae bacterium]